MASSSNPKRKKIKKSQTHTYKKPREYTKVEGRRLLENENLYELTFDKLGYVGCTYFAHRKRECHSKMYVLLCEFTLKNQIFRKLFKGEDVDLPKGTIIHDCHKICNNCFENFNEDGRRCKLCPNYMDLDYKIYCKPMLNLWNCRD